MVLTGILGLIGFKGITGFRVSGSPKMQNKRPFLNRCRAISLYAFAVQEGLRVFIRFRIQGFRVQGLGFKGLACRC